MKIVTNAKCTLNGEMKFIEHSTDLSFGDNLSEAIERYGEMLVYNHFLASAKLSAQAVIRSKLIQKQKVGEGEDAEEELLFDNDQVTSFMSNWTLSDKSNKSNLTSVERAKKMLSGLSDIQRAELLAALSQ